MLDKVALYFSIDRYANIAFIIMTGTLEEIDKYTIQFSGSNDIKEAYQAEILTFMNKNKKYIKQIESQTGKKETGDITIIEKDQKGIVKRKRVLYKKHLVVFKSIIDEPTFYDCLSESELITIDELNEQSNLLEQHLDKYFEFIREIYNKYKKNYKLLGLQSPEKIYKEYLQDMQEKEAVQEYRQLELPFEEKLQEIPMQQDYELPEPLTKEESPPISKDYSCITNLLYEEPPTYPPEDLYDTHPHDHGQIIYGKDKSRKRK